MRASTNREQVSLSRVFVVVLVLLGAVALAVAQQSLPLRLVSTAWTPFTNELGKPRFALDLVEAAFARIGVSSTTTIVAAPEFTSSLLSKRFDGSGAAWKDAEREKALIFSQAYLENRLILVGRRGEDVSATSFAALKGKKIAIVEGYSYGDAIENPGPIFVRTAQEEDSLAQLLSGAVDYTLMDELVVSYITKTYPKEAQARLQLGAAPVLIRPLYLAIRRDFPDAQSLVDRFNAQIRGMITDRTYHRLLHVDWISADVTGDGVAENIPASDKIGKVPPVSIYTLSTTKPVSLPTPKVIATRVPGFYIGGTLYSDWASVPNSYKVADPNRPDPSRSAASLFTFRW